MNTSDPGLVQAGFTDAELYAKHADELIRFATGLVGPNHAEDLLSTAVVGAIGSPKWSDVSNKRAYLFQAVLNSSKSIARSDIRRRGREERTASGEAMTATYVDTDVVDAIAGLSERQRAVVFLTYWSDMHPDAIAELLGMGTGSVKRHLARARNSLKKSLA